MKKILVLACVLLILVTGAAMAQGEGFVIGDALPDAPELAARGEYGVGVRTLTLTNPDQIDILNLSEANPTATYDRELTVDVWYPAVIPDGAEQLTTYEGTIGRADRETARPLLFDGRALRDAEPDADGAAYPLVIVSHGYPGSRYMMTYLTENLASKGYVVVAIDHTESTYADVGAFGSTLFNRATDQIFVLDEMARLSSDSESFLNGLLDADNTALIGYSMGGYGALNVIGAGYGPVLGGFLGPVIEPRLAGADGYEADARLKAAVLFAPWGGNLAAAGAPGVSLWEDEAFAGITVPTLWIVGSHDDVAYYDAIVNMFDNAVNSDRTLLTYVNALHNVAPNPPSLEAATFAEYESLSEPAWDSRRLNNINQHFITAFLGQHLQGNDDMAAYLDVAVESSNDGVYATDDAGAFTAAHTYWLGFQNRTALGMELRRENP
ncbi:MAG: dienelactone hydrolase [Chloroflexota bacterium]|nr:dienelactone hydrolase [Chloroflexota bacterium]